jgi:hypothetical protein
MDIIRNFLGEIYKDAYLQGREDGLDGIHINPHIALQRYLTDETVKTKLTHVVNSPVTPKWIPDLSQAEL